jgi:hypothetical protein
MSVLFFSFGHGSTSFRYQMVFANFYLEIITPSTYVMYDLEGTNDVDPLENPYTGSKLDFIQVHLFHGIE